MGSLDENGIYFFDETDDAAPFSELLNKLAQSVSDATGWMTTGGIAEPFELASGTSAVSGFNCESYRIGPWMFSWGRMTRSSNSSSQVWGNVAAGTSFVTPPNRILEVGNFGLSAFSRVHITSDGSLTTSSTPAGAATLSFQAMWLDPNLLP